MTSTKAEPVATCSFNQYKASERLRALAANPIDLTEEGQLSPERLKRLRVEACQLRLLYGCERVTDETLEALSALASEARAVDKMRDMQAGKVTNYLQGWPSENRPVLHTAIRDFFDEPNGAAEAKKCTALGKAEVDKLETFIKQIEGRFTDCVFVGIGGSDLGPRCLYLSLEAYRRPDRRVHFVANVDPDDVGKQLPLIDLKKTMVIVVSKSGSTLETVTNEALVRSFFEKEGLNPAEHFVSVSAQGSPMDDKSKYLECFYIWPWVGGRFSGTSMIGGVMLAFGLGFEAYVEILRGCHDMDKNAQEENPHKNIPLMLALIGIWNHNFLHHPTLAVVPYSQGLHRFAAHLQQVDMESNGKCIDRQGRPVDFETGPVVFGEPGTNAQHSFFQLVHQGSCPVPVEFIGFQEGQYGFDKEVQGTNSQQKLIANMLAQGLALAQGQASDNPNTVFPGNRPNHLILSKKLTPYVMGVLWAMVEHKVAFQGFIWDINSFDQEGVQLGKVLANRILARTHSRQGGPDSEPYPLGDALLDEIDSL